MISYQFPISRQLREINAEKIIDQQRDRPTFRVFPVRSSPVWRLEWRQRDNYRGFQQLRGINGQPSYVRMVGERRFNQEPGVFGEFMEVDEAEMTQRAADADDAQNRPINISDLVIDRQEYMNGRETDLLEWQHWAMLLNGTFTIVGPTGAIYAAAFQIQTATFSDWSNRATATPYADLLGLKLLQRGKSINFGRGAEAWMNSTMTGHLMLNTNANDLGGKFVTTGGLGIRVGAPATLGDVNTIFSSAGLASVNEYDQGYNRESDGAFQLWLADDVISIWGQRTNGDPLGEYRMVRNVNNPGNTPGRYTKVIDTLDREVPRRIEVHQGHNGGIVLFYPSAIIRANA